MYDIGAMVGGVFIIWAIAALLRWSFSAPTTPRAALAGSFWATVFAVILSAIGFADGGPPTLRMAPYYLLSGCIVGAASWWRARRRAE